MTKDRKHLTCSEVEKLLAATKGSRHEARDRCLLLLMFRHGLRVSEACALKLDQVDIESRVLHVAEPEKRASPRPTRYAPTSYGLSRHGLQSVRK